MNKNPLKKIENYVDPKLEKRLAYFFGVMYVIVIALLAVKGILWLLR
ncbi:MAG: hypothetical protein UW60_C0027G0007 [Candidatus Woesebacteria bacterium GW2011_GWA2_44_33]|uniref:Uncharacterized protein n=1 Tax=Candidatus Woesebacteria bacterium GW2011_GWA2_44_33 TaxID=1618564 RepID=A0A0G1J3N5_9BACT|nr:MAG: hypothetical protein UV85_C0019G0008 [Candidatus Nomurabacteria bacterium GW2011_GWB1_43_19]KKT66221.1 MAG: hypothetical protein UW60_C0027G0007 [Candidatus Woesebacteria bacterium GW2011_GWA2_44_33]